MEALFTKCLTINHKKDYLPLWEAMLNGDVEIVEIFIGLGADPDEESRSLEYSRHTFLQYAAKLDYSESYYQVAKVLIRHGADVNTNKSFKNRRIRLPIIYAVCEGNLKLAELLLENGARLKGPGWDDDTPAEFAFFIDDLPVFKDMLLLLYKYGLDTNYHDINGKNLLHIYLEVGDTDDRVPVTELLLDFGVPINELDKSGSSPLHEAIFKADLELTAFLIKRGADVNVSNKKVKKSPLCYAVMELGVEFVDLLLSNGADVNSSDDLFEIPALHLACNRGNIEIIKILVKNGADVSKENPLAQGPLYDVVMFAEEEHGECTIYMIKIISKLSFENRPVSKSDMDCIENDEGLKKIFNDCITELSRMEKTKFYASHSYLSVLEMSKNIKRLARMVKNEELIKAFKEKLSFHYYKNDLQQVLDEAIKLRDESRMVYSTLCSTFDNFLPDIVLRKLTENLEIEDLPAC